MNEQDPMDAHLHTQKLQPKRALSSNFTQKVVVEIKAGEHSIEKQSRRSTLLSIFQPKHWSRAGAGLAVALVRATGTAAALTTLNKPTTTKTFTKALASGNHIVGIDTTSCDFWQKGIVGTPSSTDTQHHYYEVRQGSSLTDDQIKQGMQGLCEQDLAYNVADAAAKQLNMMTTGYVQSEIMTVEAISGTSITVSPDSHLTGLDPSLRGSFTFSLNDQVVVKDGYDAATLSAIHVGDSIMAWAHDNSGKSTETADNWQPWAHPEAITVTAIVKTLPLTADPGIMYSAFAKDIVRVEPCTTSSTGFCRTYDFVK